MAELVIKLVNGELAGKTMQSITKEVNAAAQALKKAEVGTKAWMDANERLKNAKKLQEDMKKQIDATASASDTLKKAWNQLPGASFFNSIGKSLGSMKQGVGGLVTQFGVLKTAIAATGLGALVVVLGTLISYFTTTQAGIDKVTAVTRPLAAIFERLKGVVQTLGEGVFAKFTQAIDNPKQALIDLGNVLKDQIINRFTAFAKFIPAFSKILDGDLRGGFKDLANAGLQLATGVEDVIGKVTEATETVIEWGKEGIAAGTRIDELTKAIERQEIAMTRRTKQLRAEVKELNFIVEDETATLAEREAAAELAMQKQQELLDMQIQLIDMKAAKMREEQALNDTSREQELELAELEAKRFELSEQIVEMRTTMRNKLNIIRKREADEERKLQQNIEDLTIEAMKEGLEKEIAQINAEIERKKEALTGTSKQILEQELLLEEIRRQRVQEARDEAEKEQREKEKAAREKALADRLTEIDTALTSEQNRLNELWMARAITENEFLLLSSDNLISHEQMKLEAIRAAHGEQSAEYQKAYANFLSIQQAAAKQSIEITKKLNEEQMQAAVGGLQVFGNVFGGMASLYEQGTKQWKSMATAQAIISAIQGSINAYTSTAAIPIVGPALAPLAAAAALAAGYNAVQQIEQTEVKSAVTPDTEKKKMALGGLLAGPSHARGGIIIEAEGGEFIFSKKATSAIGAANLAMMNDFYTRKFANGGPVNPFPDRPPVARSGATAALTAPQNERPAWVDELIAAQDRRMDRIKVINVVTDTEDGIRTVNQIRDDASV